MYQSKKEFYQDLTKAINDTITELKDVDADIQVLEKRRNSGNYTSKHIAEVIDPVLQKLKQKLDDTKNTGLANVNRICQEYTQELEDEDALDGSKLTPDVNLLNTGVRMGKKDLDAMLKRNQGNKTMEQIILRYADDHRIQMDVVYKGNADTIANIKAIPTSAEVTFKWYNQSNVYDRIMGEGSDLARAFTD